MRAGEPRIQHRHHYPDCFDMSIRLPFRLLLALGLLATGLAADIGIDWDVPGDHPCKCP